MSSFTVAGGGHVQLVYTATASCTPATAAIQQNFFGDMALLTCRAALPSEPQLTGLAPNLAAQETTLTLRIDGINLDDATNVVFTPASGIVISNLSSVATQVTVTVEVGAEAEVGGHQVQVQTAGGLSNGLLFTVLPVGTPVIYNMMPEGIGFGLPLAAPIMFDFGMNGVGLADATQVHFSSPHLTVTILGTAPTGVAGRLTVGTGIQYGVYEAWVETPTGISNRLTIRAYNTIGGVPNAVPQRSRTWRGGQSSPQSSTPSSGRSNPEPGTRNPEPEISWTQTWSYDRFGNRKTAVTRIGETENRQELQVNGRNNWVNETAGMSYDAAGNVISDNGKTFKYDAENRMVEAVVNGVTTRYRYDGEGRRIKKTVGTAVTRFVYGMGGELIAEHEGLTATPSTLSKEYVYGPTGMLAEVTGSEVNYLTPDHLGSPRVLTSQNGIVVNRRDFFPFGEDIAVGVGG